MLPVSTEFPETQRLPTPVRQHFFQGGLEIETSNNTRKLGRKTWRKSSGYSGIGLENYKFVVCFIFKTNHHNHDSMIEVMNMGNVQKIDKQMKQSSRCPFGWKKPLDSKEPFIESLSKGTLWFKIGYPLVNPHSYGQFSLKQAKFIGYLPL